MTIWLFDLSSRKRLTEAVKAGTDRRAIFDDAKMQPVQILVQVIVIQRHWRSDVSAPGERDQPDAVVRTFVNEFLQNLFGDINAADALAFTKILRRHAARKIQRERQYRCRWL